MSRFSPAPRLAPQASDRAHRLLLKTAMDNPRPRPRRTVKARVLLAAAAGASIVTFANCGPMTSGNLLAPVYCGADAGPPNCLADGGEDHDHDHPDGGLVGGDF